MPRNLTHSRSRRDARSAEASSGGRTLCPSTTPASSLGKLAANFLHLLLQSPERSLDLNDAVDKLKAKKRRIYDVTSVLHGVDLITKGRKNAVEWKGDLSQSVDAAAEEGARGLRRLIEAAEEDAREIEKDICAAREELQRMARADGCMGRIYLSFSDLCGISDLRGANVFAIRGPTWTEMSLDRSAGLDSAGHSVCVSSQGDLEVSVFNPLCMEQAKRKRARADAGSGAVESDGMELKEPPETEESPHVAPTKSVPIEGQNRFHS